MKWIIGFVAVVIAAVGGFGVAHLRYAADESVARADVAAAVAVAEPASLPAEDENVLTSAGLLGSKSDAATQVYVKDIYAAAAGNWGAAMNQLETQLEANAPGGGQVILGGNGSGYWDLNRGAGGQFIYLGYTTTTDPAEAVTDIQFNMPLANEVDRKLYPKGIRGPEYQYVPVNLNAPWGKSRGSIVLYYSNTDGGTPASTQPFTALGLDTCWNSNRSCDSFIPDGADPALPWTRFHKDLNQGAGGNWIWLKAQRIAA